MPIRVSCQCGASFQVPDKMAGRTGKCPKCHAKITVPHALDIQIVPDPEPEPAPAPFPGAGPQYGPPGLGAEAAPIQARHDDVPPCPKCGTVYPAEIIICTTCGIEIRTGAPLGGPAIGPSSRSRVITSGKNLEEKSVLVSLGQIIYNPAEALDGLGYYILSSPANIGIVACIYVFGLIFGAAFEAREYGESAYEEEELTAEEEEALAEFEAQMAELEAAEANEPTRWNFIDAEKAFSEAEYDVTVYMTIRQHFDNQAGISASMIHKAVPKDHEYEMQARIVGIHGEDEWVDLEKRMYRGEVSYGAYLENSRIETIQPGQNLECIARIRVLKSIRAPGGRVTGKEEVDSRDYTVAGTVEEFVDLPAEEEAEAEENAMGEMAGEAVEKASFAIVAVLSFIFLVVLTAIKAAMIDVAARIVTGASRFLQCLVVLLFVDGVTKFVSFIPLFLPWDVAVMVGNVLWIWSFVIYLLAISKVYDIEFVLAFFIALIVNIAAYFFAALVFVAMIVAFTVAAFVLPVVSVAPLRPAGPGRPDRLAVGERKRQLF